MRDKVECTAQIKMNLNRLMSQDCMAFNKSCYKQVEGLTMQAPSSDIIAEIVQQYW
jgi:hypothetical protein